MQKFIPIKYSSLHTISLCELNAHIKSVGSTKIHFEAWSNHLSCNNITCLLSQKKMYLKSLCIHNGWPTLKFTNKTQKILCQPRKEKKFTKAYKPKQNYPIKTNVLTIGIPGYGIPKYLVEIIQPTLTAKLTAKFKTPHYLYAKQKNEKSNPLKSKYLML